MANRYWVGGSGTWDTTSTTNWSDSPGGASGASVPTSADSVFFDRSATYTVTMTGALNCLDITVSAGTVTFATGTTPTLNVSGSMSLIAGTVWNSTGAITFNSSTTGNTITTNGVTLNAPITFNNATGGWTLGSALTLGATLTTTLTAGALTLNDYTLTTGIFSSNNTNTRSISFGSGNIVLATTTAAQVNLAMSTSTNFTWTGTGGFTAAANITRTFDSGQTGGTATNGPNLTFTGSGTAVQTIPNNTWFRKLDFGTTAFTPISAAYNLSSITFSSGGTYNGISLVVLGTGTINGNGKNTSALTINHSGTTTLASALTVGATVGSRTTTLTSGTLDLAGFTLTTAIFISSNTNTRSISFGSGNIVLNHTSAGTTVLNIGNATNFSWTGTGGFTAAADITRSYSSGTSGGSATSAPNLTLTGSGTSIQTFSTGNWFNKLDFGTTAFTLGVNSLNLNGLTLSSGGTFTGFTANMVGTGTITSNGKTIAALTINSTSGTTTLADALSFATATATTTLTSGTLALNGFTLTTGIFSSSNTNTRSISFGSGNIVLAHTTAATTVLAMATTTNFTVSGTGGFTAQADRTRTYTFGTTGGSATNSPNLVLTGSGTSVQTFTTNSWFNTINFGTTAFTIAATTLNLNSLTLSSGGTFTNLTANMVGTGTITPNGKSIAALTINSTLGTTTLADALSVGATATTTLTSGTLALNGFTLTTGIFSSSNTTTRSISFGSGNIVLAHTTAATTVLSMADATNFSYTGTGGFTTAMTVTRTFTVGTTGGSISNAPNLSLTSGASIPTFTDGSWFKVLNFTGTTSTPATSASNIGIYVDTLTLATGGTYTNLIPVFTRTQTWSSQFSKQLGGIGFNLIGGTLTLDNTQTYTATSKCFLYSGTINLNNTNQTFGSFSGIGAAPRSITTGGSISVYGDWTVSNGESFSTDSDTIIYMNNTNAGTTTTFTGANGVYGILVQRSPNTLIVTGSNSFNDIQISNSMP